jgi:hypothetical protein
MLLVDKDKKLYVGMGMRTSINNAEHYSEDFYRQYKNHITRSSVWIRVNEDGTKEKML